MGGGGGSRVNFLLDNMLADCNMLSENYSFLLANFTHSKKGREVKGDRFSGREMM
jgi:hypothetical protein